MRFAIVWACVAMTGCGARSEPACGNCASASPADMGDSSAMVDGSVSTDDGSAGSGDDAIVSYDAPPREDIGPPSADCPPALPKLGTSCANTGLACDYASCDTTRPDRASCIAGRWQLDVAACGAPPHRCPVGLPVSGTPCDVAPGVSCAYDVGCPESANAVCSGTWSVKGGDCSWRTGKECPPVLPAVGSPCPKPDAGTSYECTYFNACHIPERSICADGMWGAEGSGAELPCETVPPCPPTEPAPGASCSADLTDKTCVWNNGCGTYDYGICDGKNWLLTFRPCGAAGCPPLPVDGSACVGSSSCTYPIGDGCSERCDCKGTKWACTQPPCGG